jgi:ubiquinone/menaquinone biosynthesis C-methylase UbiE
VRERYAAAAQTREAALCCPVDYDPQHLKVIPKEVLDRDYGCGDPSRYVREGDVVLDLGSGGGKICFIAAQLAGPKGRVIGVDVNDEMLALAGRAAPVVAKRLGFANVEFRRGRIQDLSLDLERLDAWLAKHPVTCAAGLAALEAEQSRLRRSAPLVADASVDLVVSNCVLNLVRESDKQQLVREIFRVLTVGGRIAISDIVSDEPVPQRLKDDAELWSGCISGAFHELELLRELEAAGFHGIAVDQWEHEPFAVVEGIEFRSVTITAHKGKQGPCYEANQAVIYAGPWKRVEDDDGHVLLRGERTAVCAKTFHILTSTPYATETIAIEPRCPIPEDERKGFDCQRTTPRSPSETKGLEYRETREPCAGESCC